MQTYAALQALIGDKRVNAMGIQYFLEHPSQFADLMKKDFDLAERYLKHFKQQHVNAITRSACTKNAKMRVQHYTFVKEMIDVLASASSNEFLNRNIKTSKLYHSIPDKNLVPSIWRDLVFDRRYSDNYYLYNYKGTSALYASEEITQENVTSITFRRLAEHSDNMGAICHDWQLKNDVLNSLPTLIINFLNQLEPQNTLDFEFTEKYMSSNDSFKKLIVLEHDNVIAALLRALSPAQAVRQLQMLVPSKDNKTVLHLLLNRSPASEEESHAVRNAIASMQALKFENPEAFKAFIRISKGYDLLDELKKFIRPLVNEFLAIDPGFLMNHFTETAQGLEIPVEKADPNIAANAPPIPQEDPINQEQSSSSSVGGGNTVTSMYKSPVNIEMAVVGRSLRHT